MINIVNFFISKIMSLHYKDKKKLYLQGLSSFGKSLGRKSVSFFDITSGNNFLHRNNRKIKIRSPGTPALPFILIQILKNRKTFSFGIDSVLILLLSFCKHHIHINIYSL